MTVIEVFQKKMSHFFFYDMKGNGRPAYLSGHILFRVIDFLMFIIYCAETGREEQNDTTAFDFDGTAPLVLVKFRNPTDSWNFTTNPPRIYL